MCQDIARHFQEKVQPQGFGAQVVTIDRENCVFDKQELDKHLPPEASDIVRSINSGETEYADYRPERDAEEKLVDRFRDPDDPLKVIIVTAKFLTGFDAPILQTMYLDKPLRDHTLLQAIDFDEEGIRKVVSNIAELLEKLPGAVQKCLEYFPGVDPISEWLRRIDRGPGLPAQQGGS